MPIKANKSRLPSPLRVILPCVEDPRRLLDPGGIDREAFSLFVSSVRVRSTWKTTRPGRHPESDGALLGCLGDRQGLKVLDAGASDGSTSLDLIGKLGDRFEAYLVTDVLLSVGVSPVGSTVYFYDGPAKAPFMAASDAIVAYAAGGRRLNPFARWADRIVRKAPARPERQVLLVQPELIRLAQSDRRVKISEWSVLDPWPGEAVDVLKAANLLNRSYFHPGHIRAALGHMTAALAPGGLLMIVENRAREQWSCFRKDEAGLRLVAEGGGGSDIRGFIAPA